MIYRKKHIDALREYIKDEDATIIAITGEKGIGKTTFLEMCESSDIF
jgi:predicted AAA+ superfamily ATPase